MNTKTAYRVTPEDNCPHWFFDRSEAELWMAEYADSMNDGQTFEFAEIELEWPNWLSEVDLDEVQELLFSHLTTCEPDHYLTYLAKELKGTA